MLIAIFADITVIPRVNLGINSIFTKQATAARIDKQDRYINSLILVDDNKSVNLNGC